MKLYIIPMFIIAFMFAILGFAVGINNLLIPFLRDAFNLSTTSSYLVMTATFSAFMVFGYPAGMIVKKYGYKRTIVISFFVMAAGMALFAPSATNNSFSLFLLALFVGGIGNTILQAAVNPYITILGPKEEGAKRICIMGTCNKLANAFAPIGLAVFMNLNDVKINDVILPFYIIAGALVIFGLLSYFMPLPEVTAEGESDSAEDQNSSVAKYASTKTSILQFPQLMLGAIALFFDVGMETIALGTIVDYANVGGLTRPETYTMYTTAFMVLGYMCGILFIPKFISQHKALMLSATLGVLASLIVVFTPILASIWFVAFLGLANALLWPAIWPLAIADLGKYTKTGSSVLVIAIVGGALIPLLFGWVADLLGGLQQAYWIGVPAYLYILFYSLKGYKLR